MVRVETSVVITAYEPNKKFAAKTTSGPIPVESGTKVTLVAEALRYQ